MESHEEGLYLTILVIVEGVTDKGMVEGIAYQCNVSVDVKIMRGDKPSKAVRLIRASLTLRRYRKYVVLKDLHNLDEHVVRRHLESIKRALPSLPVYTVMVRKSIESWLIADKYSGNPEEVSDPIRVLDQYLRKHGKRYFKSYQLVKELAIKLDLQKASRKSPSLRTFISLLSR